MSATQIWMYLEPKTHHRKKEKKRKSYANDIFERAHTGRTQYVIVIHSEFGLSLLNMIRIPEYYPCLILNDNKLVKRRKAASMKIKSIAALKFSRGIFLFVIVLSVRSDSPMDVHIEWDKWVLGSDAIFAFGHACSMCVLRHTSDRRACACNKHYFHAILIYVTKHRISIGIFVGHAFV